MKLLSVLHSFKGINELEIAFVEQGEQLEWIDWAGEAFPTTNQWILVRRLKSMPNSSNDNQPAGFVPSAYVKEVDPNQKFSTIFRSSKSISSSLEWNDESSEDVQPPAKNNQTNPIKPLSSSAILKMSNDPKVPSTFKHSSKDNLEESRPESPKRPTGNRLSWIAKGISDPSLFPKQSPLQLSPSCEMEEWSDLFKGKSLTDRMPKERCIFFARIISCHRRPEDRKFWYTIQVHLKGHEAYDNFLIYRLYDHFFELQTELLRMFPVEAGQSGQNVRRVLPYLPGPKLFVSEKIAESRLEDLDRYIGQLLGLTSNESMAVVPESITESLLVQSFFVPSPHDLVQHPYNGMTPEAKQKYWSGIDEVTILNRSGAAVSQVLYLLEKSPSSRSKHEESSGSTTSRPLPPVPPKQSNANSTPPKTLQLVNSDSMSTPPSRSLASSPLSLASSISKGAKKSVIAENLVRIKVYHKIDKEQVCTVTQIPRLWPMSIAIKHLTYKHPNLRNVSAEKLKVTNAKHRESDGKEKDVNIPPRSIKDFPNEIPWLWSKYVMGSGEINMLHLTYLS